MEPEQNNQNPDEIQSAINFLEENFSNAEQIVEIAFINWFNVHHHASLKDLSSKDILMVAGLMLKMAQRKHVDEAREDNGLVEEIFGPVPFDEALDFLDKGSPPVSDDEIENDDL